MKTKHKDSAEFMRPTTLTLNPRHWDWLCAKEKATGVKPSVIVRRVIDGAMEAELRRSDRAARKPL